MHWRAKLIAWYANKHKPDGWTLSVKGHDEWSVNFEAFPANQIAPLRFTYTVSVEPHKRVLDAVLRTLNAMQRDATQQNAWSQVDVLQHPHYGVSAIARRAEDVLRRRGVDCYCEARMSDYQNVVIYETNFRNSMRLSLAVPTHRYTRRLVADQASVADETVHEIVNGAMSHVSRNPEFRYALGQTATAAMLREEARSPPRNVFGVDLAGPGATTASPFRFTPG